MNFKQSRIQSKESYGGHYVKIHHYKGKNSPRRQNNPIYIYIYICLTTEHQQNDKFPK